MNLKNKKTIFIILTILLIGGVSIFIHFSDNNKISQLKNKLSYKSTDFTNLIDSLKISNNFNADFLILVQYSDSLNNEEFKTYSEAIQSISLEKLKQDSTINKIILKVENSKHQNQWKEYLYPYFHNIALRTQSVSDWNNCIRLCPANEDNKNNIHERRKIFLDYNLFNKSNINAEEILKVNPCYTPLITKMDRIHDKFYSLSDLYNSRYEKDNFLRNRFIMADFNSTNSLNECKGCVEEYAANENLSELNELITFLKKLSVNYLSVEEISNWYAKLSHTEKAKWLEKYSALKNYLMHVEKYRTAPMKKDPIIYVEGKPYCIGQRLCLCEIQNDTIIKVAQFVTSSKNAKAPQSNQHDFDGQPRYYAPQNKITSRFWDREVGYDSLDKKRDDLLGKGTSGVLKYRGAVDLPNFMHITPVDEFPGAKGFVNGIHEFAVGGKRPGLFMGTPISLGCVRLHDYPSKFTRWWTPYMANMFIAYDSKHYIQHPIKGIKEESSNNNSKREPNQEDHKKHHSQKKK